VDYGRNFIPREQLSRSDRERWRLAGVFLLLSPAGCQRSR
jgi:hypothetical protein